MREASCYLLLPNDEVQCELCPNTCVLDAGQKGICQVRYNRAGRLFTENYGLISAIHSDPIEKKPLYHFYPGRHILSIGSIGCNFKCGFCQNADISQTSVSEHEWAKKYTPTEIIALASEIEGNLGIAFTYNEPTVYYEFMMDTATLAQKKEFKTVMVSNGYINNEALSPLLDVIDAFNIDLKFFSEELYRKYSGGSLKAIKNTILAIHESGRHLELTNLVIPTLNDNKGIFNEMIDWIHTHLGENIILHLSRYFPNYHFDIPPTDRNLLLNFHRLAKKWIPYTYLGNIQADRTVDTFCKSCGHLVIQRQGYQVGMAGLDKLGKCKNCNERIVKHY